MIDSSKKAQVGPVAIGVLMGGLYPVRSIGTRTPDIDGDLAERLVKSRERERRACQFIVKPVYQEKRV